MFWSQFILAKQGPLGTIWIAAHSVNASKLRKSQIAETDLAESCGTRGSARGALQALCFVCLTRARAVPRRADTIIHQTFNHQKVPLALRLSGQLLLGVVRIYNRKLDFLHRDSAEALVKIRQARERSAQHALLEPRVRARSLTRIAPAGRLARAGVPPRRVGGPAAGRADRAAGQHHATRAGL